MAGQIVALKADEMAVKMVYGWVVMYLAWMVWQWTD
jgi:hypothetical protein